jgi:hypothetical protein
MRTALRYVRVSTNKQGEYGLGLGAHRARSYPSVECR